MASFNPRSPHSGPTGPTVFDDGVIHTWDIYYQFPEDYSLKSCFLSASSAVTYTFVYTDSEPGRAFWGADDEEVSEGGIPRVIVLGYDGLPIQPVALPSPDYIPGPENPQTPPVPQDEDSVEPIVENTSDLDNGQSLITTP
ncbi:hypothetical protein Tco_0676007 [Tanacetum coccineum]